MSMNTSRVLLVEDDPDQAGLFTLILSIDGYEVITVSDAASALARLAESPVALLLVDLDLPGMKGDVLIATVKAQYPGVKTILFSNHAHVDTVAAASGADGWFRKMDDTVHLRQLIASLLRTDGNRG